MQGNYFSEQFYMATSLCISHISPQKKDSYPANNFMFNTNGTKTKEVVKYSLISHFTPGFIRCHHLSLCGENVFTAVFKSFNEDFNIKR